MSKVDKTNPISTIKREKLGDKFQDIKNELEKKDVKNTSKLENNSNFYPKDMTPGMKKIFDQALLNNIIREFKEIQKRLKKVMKDED